MRESAAELRRRAEAFVRQGRYAEAADCYRREAAIYRRNGDFDGAKVEEMKADRWTSTLRLFAHLPDYRPAATRTQLAKFEQPYGCCIGAFLDRDERLGRSFTDENSQSHYDPDAFGQMTGKKLASAFCYVSYGRRFPSRWVSRLKDQGVVPHIAFEPNQGLEVVDDDEYLRGFARDAAQADWPVFLRFASEMNGDWTRYGGDPLRYKIKWATVQKVMAKFAPNVAMVWCVNAIPEKPIPSFYPGDGYVDWVGINFYSVPFFDNDINRDGTWANPADSLRFVYDMYASRKPIMICEYGASHRASLDNKDRSAWAAKKIHELYASLPRLYPRVKLVDIFDNDNLTYAQPGRQLNDYSVTNSEIVRAAYSEAVAPDYFLSDVAGVSSYKRPTPILSIPAAGLTVPRGILRVSAWARSYADRFSVTYTLNGQAVRTLTEPGPRNVELKVLRPGLHKLEAVLRDSQGRVAARAESKITAI